MGAVTSLTDYSQLSQPVNPFSNVLELVTFVPSLIVCLFNVCQLLQRQCNKKTISCYTENFYVWISSLLSLDN